MISVIQIIYRNNTQRLRRPPAPAETTSGIVMFDRRLSVSAFPVSPNPNHAEFDASVLQPGDRDQGRVDATVSDLTLFGG